MGEFAKDVEKILDDHAERRRSRSHIDQDHAERTRRFREEFLRLRGAIIQPAMAEAARSLSEKGQEASVTMEQSEMKGLVKRPGDLVVDARGRHAEGRRFRDQVTDVAQE